MHGERGRGAMRVQLKGIHKVRAKLAGGAAGTYWYAWRGGPRLIGEPGSPEFIKSYNDAIEERRTPDQSRFRALVTLYRASGSYSELAPSTKGKWSRWLDRIGE